jgi:ADP-ribosylglycohydrolase
MIKKDFGAGNLVKNFVQPHSDSMNYGMPMASVTDAFSTVYVLLGKLIENHCVIDEKTIIDALLSWKNGTATKHLYEKFSESIVRSGLDILEGRPVDNARDYIFCENKTSRASACVRAWVAGLLYPGNIEQAIRGAVAVTLPTHKSWISLAGSASAAAAVSTAMVQGVKVHTVVEAAINAAAEGYKMAQHFGRPSAGASVARRIELAASIGINYGNDPEQCIQQMTDFVGNGIHVNETLPSAVGYFTASGGDIQTAIVLAANAGGNNTETSVIAGALTGAFNGSSAMDASYMAQLADANQFMDIPGLVKAVYEYMV